MNRTEIYRHDARIKSRMLLRSGNTEEPVFSPKQTVFRSSASSLFGAAMGRILGRKTRAESVPLLYNQ